MSSNRLRLIPTQESFSTFGWAHIRRGQTLTKVRCSCKFLIEINSISSVTWVCCWAKTHRWQIRWTPLRVMLPTVAPDTKSIIQRCIDPQSLTYLKASGLLQFNPCGPPWVFNWISSNLRVTGCSYLIWADQLQSGLGDPAADYILREANRQTLFLFSVHPPNNF